MFGNSVKAEVVYKGCCHGWVFSDILLCFLISLVYMVSNHPFSLPPWVLGFLFHLQYWSQLSVEIPLLQVVKSGGVWIFPWIYQPWGECEVFFLSVGFWGKLLLIFRCFFIFLYSLLIFIFGWSGLFCLRWSTSVFLQSCQVSILYLVYLSVLLLSIYEDIGKSQAKLGNLHWSWWFHLAHV